MGTSRVLPRPDGPAELAWWAAVLGTSTIVLLGVDRLARRALPLAALLRLTLVFPDRAPSRVSVALRSRNLRSLRAWAQEASEGGDADQSAGQRATAVLALAAALNAHDRRTRGHSERVRVLSLLLAEELQLSEADAARLGWAALLHDIGKLTVPPAILNKPGAPDEREWEILRRHPADGARIARPLHDWLGGWIDAIEDHHEKYDGSGYPHGIEGKDIPLAARIVSLTDSFETMTAVRSYKKPMSAAAAREELARCAGKHFDPDLVRAFFNISLGRITWKMGVASWLVQLPFLGAMPRAGAAVGRAGTAAPASGGTLASIAAVAVSVVLAVGGANTASSENSGTSASGSTGGGTQAPDPGEIAVAGTTSLVPDGPAGETTASEGSPSPAAAVTPTPAGVPPEGSPPPPHGNGGGRCPPGQEDHDWSGHPHGGPPGQRGRCR